MALYYRVLGLFAAINSILECISFYHIRLNWLVLALLLLISAGGAERLSNPKGEGVLASLQAPPVLVLVAPLVVLGLFVVCIVKKNLIFRLTTSIRTDGSTSRARHEDGQEYVTARVSGWFQRGGGSRLWLRDCPAYWDISEDGTIALVTGVAGGSQSHGFPAMEDLSGNWNLTVSRAMLQADPEDGIVYFALSARPALRLRVPEKPEGVVLTVDNTTELLSLRHTLDELLAESGRREASFASRLDAIATPTQVEQSPVQAVGKKQTDGGIAWDKLIDLSS
jgi:hypothetical protein